MNDSFHIKFAQCIEDGCLDLLHLSRGPALLQSPFSSSSSPLLLRKSRQLSVDIDRENSRRGDVGPSSNPTDPLGRVAPKPEAPRSNRPFSLKKQWENFNEITFLEHKPPG